LERVAPEVKRKKKERLTDVRQYENVRLGDQQEKDALWRKEQPLSKAG
jgi:hypothetical protein